MLLLCITFQEQISQKEVAKTSPRGTRTALSLQPSVEFAVGLKVKKQKCFCLPTTCMSRLNSVLFLMHKAILCQLKSFSLTVVNRFSKVYVETTVCKIKMGSHHGSTEFCTLARSHTDYVDDGRVNRPQR